MKFVVITGLSGAGKSTAVKVFEDIGYFCIDNMPTALITKFAEICATSRMESERVAFVIDARGGHDIDNFLVEMKKLEELGNVCEILFLEADDRTLTARYKETRRMHPSSPTGRIIDGIEYERSLLSNIRKNATYVIDTSGEIGVNLKNQIRELFVDERSETPLFITVTSFGFKYGIPIDSDLVFDVRFLPNPFYVKELKGKSGLDREVYNFVFGYEQTHEFVKKLEDMIDFTLPLYIEEGKSQLMLSIGCTGGRHRSVAIADEINRYVEKKGYRTRIIHRDINK